LLDFDNAGNNRLTGGIEIQIDNKNIL